MSDNVQDELLAKAAALVPGLRERAAETDELRRLPDETVKELHELGLLGVAAPRELGGLGLDPGTIAELAMVLARGSGAAAWCGGNWAVHTLLGSMFTPQAQEEIFGAVAPRMPVISTGFSPLRGSTERVDGGAVISGQWDFASGVDHAEWVVVMAIAPDGPLAHLVPTSELEIVDTWHTSGLRGSGSKDVAAQGLFVPEHRLLSMIAPGEGQSSARELYPDLPFLRLPMGSFFGCAVAGTIVGLAQGALEMFQERTGGNIGGLSGVQVSARPEVHHKMGESAADIRAATQVLRSTYDDMRAAALAGVAYSTEDRLRWRRDPAWAAKAAVRAVSRLYEVGGAHVLFSGDALEQNYRDIIAASHHYGMAWDALFAGYGRHMNGLEHGVAMV